MAPVGSKSMPQIGLSGSLDGCSHEALAGSIRREGVEAVLDTICWLLAASGRSAENLNLQNMFSSLDEGSHFRQECKSIHKNATLAEAIYTKVSIYTKLYQKTGPVDSKCITEVVIHGPAVASDKVRASGKTTALSIEVRRRCQFLKRSTSTRMASVLIQNCY